jgi:lambda family phage portal protein
VLFRSPRPLRTEKIIAGAQVIERELDRSAELSEQLWSQWVKSCDVEGVHNWASIQDLVVKAWVTDGECFVVRRVSRAFPGVPLRLDVLEADMLDEARTESLADGARIIAGLEFDSAGRRVAYHFHREHPSETLIGSGFGIETVRVRADDVIHVFDPARPKQVRGISKLSPILAKKTDYADFERFELQRKKTEAMVVGGVIPGDDLDLDTPNDPEDLVGFGAVDADGAVVESMEPGMFVNLRNGKDVRFFQPTSIGGYGEYKRATMQETAVGVQLTYELLTGDLSQTNYSSLRAGMLQFWSYLDQLQWAHFIPKVCDRVWVWFCEAAYLDDQLPEPRVPVSWSTPKRPQVDPLKDVQADYLKVRGGFVPHEEVAPEYGYTLELIAEAEQRPQDLFAGLGVTFDSDQQRYSWRGATPVPGDTEPPLDEEGEDEES